MDIIWDRYKAPGIKDVTREARGSGIRQKVDKNRKLIKNQENFLRVSEREN